MSRKWARLALVAIWLPTIVYAVVVTRQFFHVANSAIFLSTDDAMANISYALATEGRYGFLSSPVLAGMARHEGLFSYGPFYFYLGAGLIWLFGYNLVLLRSIHLILMLAIAALAGRWFRGFGSGALGVLPAIGLLMAFERAHWPMVRPDSMVSLFAVLLVMAAGAAIRTGRLRYWAIAGICAACGAFTHLVAWALVPASVVTLLVASAAEARDPERAWTPASIVRPLLALLAGGLIGAVAFYGSFGFRINDQLLFLTDYQQYTGSMTSLAGQGAPYKDLLIRHFEQAYWFLPYPMAYLVGLVLVASVAGVIAVIAWPGMPGRRLVLAMLAPPTVTWILYFASLGGYNNFHAGYAILNQVMWLWSGTAVIASAIEVSGAVWPSMRRVTSAAVWVTSLAVGVGMLTVLAPRTSYRTLAADTLTPIDQYVNHVLDTMPARARAWGTVEFGIEHPNRVQLVQFWDGIKALNGVAPDRKVPLAPDYLVWGSVENGLNAGVVIGLNGSDGTLDPAKAEFLASWRLVEAFPLARYGLASITVGPPYGATRVYGDAAGLPAIDRPMVNVYDPVQRQWSRGLGAEASVETTEAVPVVLRQGLSPAVPAVQTLRGELAAGLYLIKVSLLPSLTTMDAAMIVASGTPEIQTDITQATSGVDVSPWFADQGTVYLVYHHSGGAVFVSQFGTQRAALAGIAASRILPLPNYRQLRREQPPEHALAASQWSAAFPEISLTSRPGGDVSVVGTDTIYGYQAYGPRIPVEPGQRMRLRVPVSVTAGRGCIGVLDGTELRWLLAPDSLRPEYEFQVNDSRTVKPVLADCSGSPATVTQLRATIGNGSYAVWSDRDELYVDQLMRESRNAAPR